MFNSYRRNNLMNDVITVMIAEDQQLVREGIIALLEKNINIAVLGEASNGNELVQKHDIIKPLVTIVDIEMPVMNGFEATKKIKQNTSDAIILFLSSHCDNKYIYKAYKAGGMGFVHKNVMRGELIYAIQKVSRGDLYYSNAWTSEKLDKLVKMQEINSNILNGNSMLTNKETEVLQMIKEGYTSQEIANRLFISKRTVDCHRANIMQKSKCKNLSELFRITQDV